ncbi:hypothetical protein L804_02410 [Cryptococcus deuterogattii 2001/935-1]|nr:hypothetical protein I352_02625 [Cryptococcus deuterogattii MMRL2647]KIR99776.1 hypothetical protein L804_02410 [Cryptococcus deuterogattii 2001/935-1]
MPSETSSGEPWERLMNELQMKVKYPKTREDVEYMFDTLPPDIAKKNEQMHLYKEVAVLEGCDTSRGVEESHQLDRSSRKREAPSAKGGRNEKQSESNENKEEVISSVNVECADSVPRPITPPDTVSKLLFDPFINEPCVSKAGLEMCSGVNSGSENGMLHSPVPELVQEEEIKPHGSELVDENEPDIPISQRGDEEDIVDEMERREEERELYLALYSVLEQRGFRFLLGGQKVFSSSAQRPNRPVQWLMNVCCPIGWF